MGTKVTLKALDHILMASLRHKQKKFSEAAKHLQLATEQEDFGDTLETLNAANAEGWEDGEEMDEEVDEEIEEADADELDDEDLDADLEGDEEEAADEDDLDMIVEDDEEMEEDEGEEMAQALASATRRSARRRALAAEDDADADSAEDDADDEAAEDDEAEEAASVLARRKIRAQANLRIQSRASKPKGKPKAKK